MTTPHRRSWYLPPSRPEVTYDTAGIIPFQLASVSRKHVEELLTAKPFGARIEAAILLGLLPTTGKHPPAEVAETIESWFCVERGITRKQFERMGTQDNFQTFLDFVRRPEFADHARSAGIILMTRLHDTPPSRQLAVDFLRDAGYDERAIQRLVFEAETHRPQDPDSEHSAEFLLFLRTHAAALLARFPNHLGPSTLALGLEAEFGWRIHPDTLKQHVFASATGGA